MAGPPEVSSLIATLEQSVATIVAGGLAVFANTWGNSPVFLPLPKNQSQWLRRAPILAAVVMMVFLWVWFTKCEYMEALGGVAIASLITCLILMVIHHRIASNPSPAGLENSAPMKTSLIVLCFAWSISGILAMCSAATLLAVKQQMDETYRKHPLTLWQMVDGKKKIPEDTIFLTSGLPAYLRPELQECGNTLAETSLSPELGKYEGEIYSPPTVISEQKSVKFTARSRVYGDIKQVTIMLLPDGPDIRRTQYPIEDGRGRKAVLDVIVISRNDSWVYNNEELVQPNRLAAGDRQPAERVTPVCRPITALAGSHAFDAYSDVIGVGTASREGVRPEEDGRAGRRSKVISQWINEALQKTGRAKHIYVMNLGQYLLGEGDNPKLPSGETAAERPVIIFGVVRKSEVDVVAAVQRAIASSSDDFFEMLRAHYTKREIAPFEELPAPDKPCLRQ
jgi:hypothetical protein